MTRKTIQNDIMREGVDQRPEVDRAALGGRSAPVEDTVTVRNTPLFEARPIAVRAHTTAGRFR